MDGLFNVTDLNDFRKKSFRLIQESEGPKDFHTNLFGDEKQFQKKSVKSDFRPKYVRPAGRIRSAAAYIEHIKYILLSEGLDSQAKDFVSSAYSLSDIDDIYHLSEKYILRPERPDIPKQQNESLNFNSPGTPQTDFEDINADESRKQIALTGDLRTLILAKVYRSENSPSKENILTLIVRNEIQNLISNAESDSKFLSEVLEVIEDIENYSIKISPETVSQIRNRLNPSTSEKKSPEIKEIDSSEIFSGINLDDSDFIDDDSYSEPVKADKVGKIYQIRPGYVFRVLSNDGIMIEREWISHPESKGRKDRIQSSRINWNFLKELDSLDSAEPAKNERSHRSGREDFDRTRKYTSKLADQIRKKAESLSDIIEKKMNPVIGNQNYTRRRAYIASGIREEGERFQIAQKLMFKAVDKIEKEGKIIPKWLLQFFESRPMMLRIGYYIKADNGEYGYNEPWKKKDVEERKEKSSEFAKGLEFAQNLLKGENISYSEKRIKQEKLNSLRNAKIPGFFPTPKKVIQTMLDLIQEITGKTIGKSDRVLEPSAGKGDIAEELRKMTDRLDVCELNYTLSDILKEEGYNIAGSDFLEYNPGPIYDFIIMNPPFEKNQDSRHIIHAYSLLKPGGVIAAVASSTFNNDKTWNMFSLTDEENKSIGIFPLEKDSFKGKDSFVQTGVNAVIVILENLNPEDMSLAEDELYSIQEQNINDNLSVLEDELNSMENEDSEEFNSVEEVPMEEEPEEIRYHHIFGYPENEFLEDSAYVDDETDEEALFNEWKSDIPYETAKRAHYGTSMSPDKRGHQERESYAVMLNDVYKIRKQAEKLGREKDFDSDFAVFRRKFRDLYLDSLNAKSRVLSPMISGSANFPTRRNQKANSSADAKNSDMLEYKKKTLRRFELEYRPETDKPILTGAADSLQKLKDKLQSLYRSREAMKEANKIIRSGKDIIPRLQKMGYSDKDIHGIMNPYFGKPGFASYAFQNLSSEISRVKERILQEEKLQTVKESGETEFKFAGGTVEADIEGNRWKIFYDSKPDSQTISDLKKNGWKWAPSVKAWQRFYTSWPKSRFSLIGIALQESDREELKESRTDLEEPESIREESEETVDEFEKEFIQELEEDYQPEYQGNYTGRKYQETQNMDIAQIAKLIRNDIRDAIKKKKLPSHPKYSVTIERYSMGQSVTVRVTNILPLRIMNEQAVVNELSYTSFHGPRLNQAGKNLDNILTDICRQYGFDNSDSMTDYFHSRFHTHISLQTDPEYNLIKSEYEQRKEIERTEQKKSVQAVRRPEIDYRPKENLNILDFRKRKDFIPAQRNENLPALRVNQPIETVRPRQNLFEVHSVDDLFQNQERTIELNRYQDDSWRFPKKNDFQLHGPENLQRLPFGSSKRVRSEKMTEDRKQNEKPRKKKNVMTVDDLTEEQHQKLIEITKKKSEEALSGKTRVNI